MRLRIIAVATLTVLAVLGTRAAAAQVGSEARPGLGGSATIAGRVTFTDGTPAGRITVEWRPAGNPNGGSTVQTAPDGSFTITGLKDGIYFVGYFHPSRVPADKNPAVETVSEGVTPELAAIGAPVAMRVTISSGASAKGIGFVITNIGDERVEGPETSGDRIGLPPVGQPPTVPITTGATGPSAGMKLLLALGISLIVAGVAAVAWPALRRGPR